jgi:hypothetical protein
MKRLDKFELDPAVRLDGRIIRTAADAVALLREHETRPGVDDRDEVLHQIERAQSEAELHAALDRFRAWLTTWGVTVPTAPEQGSTQGSQN